MSGIETRIGQAGRVVIPKSIRERAGLREGTPVEVTLTEDGVVIRPRTLQVRIETRGRIHVLVPEEPVARLDTEEVRRATEALRSRGAPGG